MKNIKYLEEMEFFNFMFPLVWPLARAAFMLSDCSGSCLLTNIVYWLTVPIIVIIIIIYTRIPIVLATCHVTTLNQFIYLFFFYVIDIVFECNACKVSKLLTTTCALLFFIAIVIILSACSE